MKRAALALCALLALAERARAQTDTVPFELKSNLIVVTVTVNGAERRMVLDTGSPATLLAPAAADKPTATLAAGRAVVRDLPVTVADLPAHARDFDGVLGLSWISRFTLTIDFQARTLKLVPNDPAAAHAGFAYATIGDDVANEIGVEGGVVVKAVAPDSPASKAGLKKGDVLQEVDGKRVDRAEDWQKILAKAKPGDVLKLSLIRDRKDVTVELTLGERK